VLTAFVPADDSTLTDAMWLEGVRKHFAGQVDPGTVPPRDLRPPRDVRRTTLLLPQLAELDIGA